MEYLISEDYLAHYGRSKRDGAPHGSGRYPLGSGENPQAAPARYAKTAKASNAAGGTAESGKSAKQKKVRYNKKKFNKDVEDVIAKTKQEAEAKSQAEYDKILAYMDKNNIDYEDLEVSRKYLTPSKAKQVDVINKMFEDAAEKEEQYYQEAGEKGLEYLFSKYGEKTVKKHLDV